MDDVDAFLASLEAFTVPSIVGGIQQANGGSTSTSQGAAVPHAGHAPSGTTHRHRDRSHHHSQTSSATQQKREREDNQSNMSDRAAGADQQTSSLPLFSSARARAQDEARRHQRRRTEGPAHGSPASTVTADGPGAASSWSCVRCTFLNDMTSTRCQMCDGARPPMKSSTVSAPVPPVALSCPRCTFLNVPGATTCTICEARLPPSAHVSAPSTLGSNFLAAVERNQYSNNESLASINPATTERVNTHTSTSTTHGPASSDSPGSAENGGSEGMESSNADSNSEDEDDDGGDAYSESEVIDTSDEDDDSDDSQPDHDDNSGHTGGEHRGAEETYRSRELVSFLQNLEAVPFDKLPCAAVPATMQEKAHLHPFQLQALHWMLSREQHHTHLLPPPSQSIAHEHAAPSAVGAVHTDGSEDGHGVGQSPDAVSSNDLRQVRGGVFADYMGLGKTRTLLSLCEATRGPHYDRVTGSQIASHATLIVCPTALTAQWASEIRECVRCPLTRQQAAAVRAGREFTRSSAGGGPLSTVGGVPSASSSSMLLSSAAALAAPPKVLLYYGSRRRRVTLFELAQQYDYVITSYQTLCHEPPVDVANGSPGKMYMIQWKRIILDEAHMIRNTRTVQSRTCLKLTGVYRWVVTATPVHNSVNDLYPLLRFLQVPYFSDLDWWNREIVGYFNRDPKSPRATTALKILFAALLLRRTPDSVVNGKPILSMPPKLVTTRVLALSKAEAAFYRAVKDNAMSKLDEAQCRQTHFSRTPLTTFSTAFTMLMRCRQACLHPYIVVAALRRVKLQLSAETAAVAEVTRIGEGGTATTSPHAESEASMKAARDAAAASALQEAVNRYVDAVLMRKVRASVTRGDSSFLHDLVNELKQQKLVERECIICLDTLCRPAILPCAHTFCYECIHQALHVTRRCPLCKQAAKPGDVLEVPEELIRTHRTTEGMNGDSAGGVPHTSTSHSDCSKHGNNATTDSKASLDAAMRAMQASEAVLRDPAQWPLVLSSKTEFLLDALTRKIPGDEKVVVFSHFVTYLLYAQQVLEKHGIVCALYTGALSMRQRDKVLARFRGEASGAASDAGPRVLLATITTCGVGLNLTCANHCFLMEPTWNPGVEEQALNRVHRIGQTRAVEVTKLIARDTVEERVEGLCQYKKGLSSVCFGGAGGAGGARIRTDDLLNLFRDPTPTATSTDEDEQEDKDSDSSSEDVAIDIDSSSSESPSSSDDEHGSGGARRRAHPRQTRRRRRPTAPRQRHRHQHQHQRQDRRGTARPPSHPPPQRSDDAHQRASPMPETSRASNASRPGNSVNAPSFFAEAVSRLPQTVANSVWTAVSTFPAERATAGASQTGVSGVLSSQQRVLDACQRGLSILNRTMRGD